jgi:hypothetical protein
MGASLVEEEQPLPGGRAQPHPGLLNAQVLHDGPDADEQAKRHDQPPEPRVVGVRHGQVSVDTAISGADADAAAAVVHRRRGRKSCRLFDD